MITIPARPRPESATNWADPVLEPAMRLAAESMCVFGGFLMVSVCVVVDDVIHNVAVASSAPVLAPSGEPATLRDYLEATYPVEALEALLAPSERWGALHFLSHERGVHRNGWRVRHEFPSTPSGAWHTDDLLVVPIRDDAGDLRGLMRLDGPVDGMIPRGEERRRLEQYASQSAQVVQAALGHEHHRQQVRALEAARLLLSNVAATTSFEEGFAQTAPTLMTTFDLAGMRVGTFQPERMLWHGEAPDIAPVQDYTTFIGHRRRATSELWAHQEVSIIGLSQSLNQRTTPDRVAQITDTLSAAGLDSLMLVPMGAADRCVGGLWLYRRHGRWTESEQQLLQDVGRDLGRLFLNAEALQAQHRLTQQLQELEGYKRGLISMISHELKTPLTSIRGNAEFLADAESESDIQRSAAAIARGAARMTGMVDELLLIARLDQPGTAIEPRPVDLAAVAVEAIALNQTAADQAQVSVSMRADRAAVLGNPDDLITMASNLIGNAIKYSDAAAQVTVRTSCRGDCAVLEVSDTGIGLETDGLDRLFGEFERGTDAAALVRPGSGLGLAIVDRIVRNHGGAIEVRSVPHEGSTFRVLLPRTG